MMQHDDKPRRLRTFVSVPRGDGPLAEHVMFGPGDDVPEWAREKIVNPKCWADDDEPEVPQPAAPSMIGHAFESGSLVSGPMTTTSGQPPSAPSPGGSRRGPSGSPGPEAARGIAEAARRFGTPPGDAA